MSVHIYIYFNEGKFKVELHCEIRVCLSLESPCIMMDFSSNLRNESKLSPNATSSWLVIPLLPRTRHTEGWTLPLPSWVRQHPLGNRNSFLPNEIIRNFSILQAMGKISFYRTKRSKALPWHLNLADRPRDSGLWPSRGDGWLWTSC